MLLLLLQTKRVEILAGLPVQPDLLPPVHGLLQPREDHPPGTYVSIGSLLTTFKQRRRFCCSKPLSID